MSLFKLGHSLVNFRKSDLKISAVSKVTVAADGTSYTATEIGLSVESLFNSFTCEVGVSSVDNFEKCYLRITW